MENIAEILEAHLDYISLRHLRLIADTAQSYGVQAYLVGGAVRDALLGLPVGDIDIAVVCLTSDIVQNTATALGGEIVKRSQFNTFALSADGRRIDLAMSRQETYAHAGALPTVAPGTIRQDLARRDFTINAMAASINAGSFGELLDPLDGQGDLRRRIARVLHNASFQDDATRILRAARYAVRLGFTLEAQTERLLRRDAPCLDTISGARLRHEFMRVLQEDTAVATLELLYRLGALQVVHSALTLDDRTLEAISRAADSDYADKTALLLSILAFGLTDTDKTAFAERLRLPVRLAQAVDDTASVQGILPRLRSAEDVRNSEIYTMLRALGEAAILGCALREGDSGTGRRLTLYLDELRHIKPMLNGDELLALGVPQGRQIGELLQSLLIARLDGQVETRQDEIAFVQARL